jgi:hypothetical protein
MPELPKAEGSYDDGLTCCVVGAFIILRMLLKVKNNENSN